MIKVLRKRLEVKNGFYTTDPKNIVIEGDIRRDKSCNLNPNVEDLVIMDKDEYQAMMQKVTECEDQIRATKVLYNSDIYLEYDLDNNRPGYRLCIPTEFRMLGTPKFTIIFNDRAIEYTANKEVGNVGDK